MAIGKVIQIIGPVIDCEFDRGELPKINDAIRILAGKDGVSYSDSDVFCEVLSLAFPWARSPQTIRKPGVTRGASLIIPIK